MTLGRLAKLLLAGASGLAALATLYCLVHGGHPNLLTCALPAAALSLLAGLAARLGETQRIGVALAASFTVATLWSIDAVLALRPPARTPDEQLRRAARAAGVNLDRRTPLEAVRDQRRTHPDAYPAVYMGNYWENSRYFTDTLYPLGGISGVTSLMCNESEWVVYGADEHGLTNPPGVWSLPRLEVAAVGDSYAMGWCVPPAESFVARIRERYPATLALGFGASGPLTQLGQIREYLPARRPRVVLWFYFERNDLADLDTEKNHPVLQRYLRPGFSQRLEARQAEVDARLRSFADARERRAAERVEQAARRPSAPPRGPVRRLWDVVRLVHLRERVTAPTPAAPPRSCCDLRLYRSVVQQAKATIAGWDGELVAVYLPSEQRLSRRGGLGPGEQAGDSVVAILRALDVPVIDLRERLREFGSARELYAFAGAHFSARGHQAVATVVLQKLAQRD